MIQSDLLRYKLDNKNNKIHPILCSLNKNSKDLEIAIQVIQAFEYCYENKLIKEKLDQLLKNIEIAYKDFKLVRGLSALLERGCEFRSMIQTNISKSKQPDVKNVFNYPYNGRNLLTDISAAEVRKMVFEESSNQGIAVDKNKRELIIQIVSNKLNINADTLVNVMWSDLEENSVIYDFTTTSPEQLILSYNISCIQTLLFGCIQMKVWLQSGQSEGTLWKEILRDVKRLGLMYWLDLKNDDQPTNDSNTNIRRSVKSHRIICTIEGAMNVLKLTDRYGSAISKLFPVILKSQEWNIDCDILRTSFNGKRLIYKFEIANDTYPNSIPHLENQERNIHKISYPDRNNTKRSTEQRKTSDITQTSYDSKIEKTFSEQFELMQTGWKIEREPEPIITSQKTAFIPDFIISKFDIEIIVEIVGFWTKEYLERKISKMNDVIQKKKNEDEKFFMILVINYSNLMSYEINEDEKFSVFKSTQDRYSQNVLVTSYKQNKVSFKDIITYLKGIEERYIKHQFLDESKHEYLIKQITDSLMFFSGSDKNVISLEELEQFHKKDNLDTKLVKIGFLDLFSKNSGFNEIVKKLISQMDLIFIKDFIFKKRIVDRILHEMKGISTLGAANELMKSEKIPEKIQIDLLIFLGFQISWDSLDFSKAKLAMPDYSIDPNSK